MRLHADDQRRSVSDTVGLPRQHRARILFAIARDPRTIFASWNIDWLSLFEKVLPVDRQVHLRVYGADGLEEQRVAVEPMAMMHYLTTSGQHESYRVEIGYYRPADVWNSVATSDAIVMPPNAVSGTIDVDLATIPFHVAFQQLLGLFGAKNGAAPAAEISKFQEHVIRKGQEALTADEKKILEKLNVSVPEIAIARRTYTEVHCEKLARRTRVFVSAESTSPSRRFEAAVASAAS